MEMLEQARTIIKKLEANGFAAYFVGGFVRDTLCSRPVKDVDIATSAKPEEVIGLFPHTSPTGLHHGTVTVIETPFAFEVTTFRQETDYADYRRPQTVQFVSKIEADLQRRDFTINAMAMDAEGNLVDPFGGQEDLERQILRCVGNAMERFEEDALRLMRCIRFASEYRLQIEEGTWKALLAKAALLQFIAVERVQSELDRMMLGQDPARSFALLAESRLLSYTKTDIGEWLPYINALHSSELDKLAKVEASLNRWALLLILSELTPQDSEQLLRTLLFPNRTIRAVCSIVKLKRAASPIAEAFKNRLPGGSLDELRREWMKLCLRFGKETAKEWLRLAPIVSGNEDKASSAFILHASEWLRQMPVSQLSELHISGGDISGLRMEKGPWIAKVLWRLLEETAAGEIPNERSRLLHRAEILAKEGAEIE